MKVLVLNSGSSSIKFSLFSCGEAMRADAAPALKAGGELSGIGGDAAALKVFGDGGRDEPETKAKAASLPEAVSLVLDAVSKASGEAIEAVGYRVVHPGPVMDRHQRITPEVLRLLEDAKEYAPLHDPEALMLIRATMARYPEAAHYACFDTVFHQSMPEEAKVYPLPETYREGGVHRYGFHGLSCESIVRQMAAEGGVPRRLVIAHLGSGCSVTAVLDGKSVDTTMGLTPTGGVLMGTRSGDLDPGLVIFLLRREAGSREDAADALETLLNHGSGISVLSGLENDMKETRAAAAKGDEKARLALKVFTRRLTKAIGGFSWLLGGLDVIVFTGGIGEHDAATRNEVLAGLTEMGVELDTSVEMKKSGGVQRISAEGSRTAVYVAPAQEDLMIAIHVQRMVGADGSVRFS
jgi:acetate kinase